MSYWIKQPTGQSPEHRSARTGIAQTYDAIARARLARGDDAGAQRARVQARNCREVNMLQGSPLQRMRLSVRLAVRNGGGDVQG